MAERTIVQARESFAVYLTDGRPFSVVTGDRFYSDDPVVRGREQLFGGLVVRTSQGPSHKPAPAPRAVETADAAPAQRRVVTRPADKTADKTADKKGEV